MRIALGVLGTFDGPSGLSGVRLRGLLARLALDGTMPARGIGPVPAEPQHVAEIIALAALQSDRLARSQCGIDKQPGAAKIELRHDRSSNWAAF